MTVDVIILRNYAGSKFRKYAWSRFAELLRNCAYGPLQNDDTFLKTSLKLSIICQNIIIVVIEHEIADLCTKLYFLIIHMLNNSILISDFPYTYF